MAKQINRLSARSVQALLDKPGRYADGGGLYLNTKGGHRWVFLFRWRGKLKEMGLGSAAPGHVSLKDARDRAARRERPLRGQTRETCGGKHAGYRALCASRLMIINRGCDVSPQIDVGDTFADDETRLISIKPLSDMR